MKKELSYFEYMAAVRRAIIAEEPRGWQPPGPSPRATRRRNAMHQMWLASAEPHNAALTILEAEGAFRTVADCRGAYRA